MLKHFSFETFRPTSRPDSSSRYGRTYMTIKSGRRQNRVKVTIHLEIKHLGDLQIRDSQRWTLLPWRPSKDNASETEHSLEGTFVFVRGKNEGRRSPRVRLPTLSGRNCLRLDDRQVGQVR